MKSQTVRWWLHGEEECAHCGQAYSYEIEFRCQDCDAAGCPHCGVRLADGRMVCPACTEAPREDAHHG